jgi:hypothetical protein
MRGPASRAWGSATTPIHPKEGVRPRYMVLRTFCVYDAPAPEAVRTVAARNGLPVDGIDEVRVLDPHFHH